ncbi:MAG: winged helix-turn-helix transcriptional regulator [Clostridiales bacterium]|nr:winged helix-turn-helix transcriptional regulator [Clostridiales bacterium]
MESQTLEWKESWRDAICHRDYSTGIPIQIKVFPDKVIIYNDGYLPRGLDDLLTTHRSEPHNPMIAGVFFRAGMIESWGRGIEHIKKVCKSAGKPEPTIAFKNGNEFAVTFYSDADITTNITTNITTKFDVNETQKRIMFIMSENPNVKIKKIAAELGIAERNIKSHINLLKTSGMVERVGANKNGQWVVK